MFFCIYSFDLIWIWLTKLCKYMLFHYFFVFIYIAGVSSICSEKNCIAFLVNLLTKSVFVFFQKPAILQFLTSNNFLKRTVRYCLFFFVLDYKY